MTVTNLRAPTAQNMVLVEVTPQLAAEWLATNNVKNRALSASRVRMYAATMSRGLWRHPTGEPIIFDRLNRIQDGQHRLAAQVDSQATILYWVLTDADPEDFSVIDQGKSRRAGDVLGMDGVANANQVAAITRTFLHMRDYPDRIWQGGVKVLPAEVTQFGLAHGDKLGLSARRSDLMRKATRLPRTALGAVDFYVSHVHHAGESPNQWIDFTEALKSGAQLGQESPELTLRKWAISRPTTQGVSQQLQVALITKAWNAYVDQRPLTRLTWQTSSMPMPLPKAAAY